MNVGHLLFGFQGRINRAKFWLAALIYFVVIFAAVGLAIAFDPFVWMAVAIYVVLLISSVSSCSSTSERLRASPEPTPP